MSSDDLHFLSLLAGVSNDIRKFSADVMDATDRQLDAAATTLNELLPISWRIRSPPSPVVEVQASYLARLQDWVSSHRAITAAVLAFIGTTAVVIYAQKRGGGVRKRRARRAPNGARKEVVVVVGPPRSLIVKSLIQDLERRGFIVYCVTESLEEEQIISAESRPDIKPFSIEIGELGSLSQSQDALERFGNLLRSQHQAFAGAVLHRFKFSGLIVVPELNYPSRPIEMLPPEVWSGVFNDRILKTITTIQLFLPVVCEFQARILMLLPNIVHSLKPAFHGLESSAVGALDAFSTTLQREMDTLGVNVSKVNLGTFDMSVSGVRNPSQADQTSIANWPVSGQSLYGQNFLAQSRNGENRGIFSKSGAKATSRGAPFQDLHRTVFDALTVKRSQSTWYVGRGSATYGMVARWVPAGLVGWMLGMRRVPLEDTSKPVLEDGVHSWEKVERSV